MTGGVLIGAQPYRSPRTDLVQLLVHGLDPGQVGRVVAEPFGVARGLRIQPGGVLRVDELSDRVRQVPSPASWRSSAIVCSSARKLMVTAVIRPS
jgi:hypothetical protein